MRQWYPIYWTDAGRVDALVNNAGYALWGSLEDVTIEEVKAQFETNVFAVLRLSQAFLPHMRERTNGTIVNVGSVAGRIGTPAGGAYAASKFALRGLTNVMRMELAPFGVRVVLIEPGLFSHPVPAEPNHRTAGTGPQVPLQPPHPAYSSQLGLARALVRGPGQGSPHHNQGDQGAQAKPRYTVGADAFLGSIASRLLPDSLLHYIVTRATNR